VREKCQVREPSGIVRYSTGCEDKPYNWVRRKGREREEKKGYLLAKREDKNYMLYLNIIYHSSMDVALERG
jgi:hypothetical protein